MNKNNNNKTQVRKIQVKDIYILKKFISSIESSHFIIQDSILFQLEVNGH